MIVRNELEFSRWITAGSRTPFYARKIMDIPGRPEKAEAYVCGLGQFNFYVNGEKAGDHLLDPAWTDYRKIIYYVHFDISEYVHPGKNMFAAEVGNGWYLGDKEAGYFFHFPPFMPPNPNDYQPFDEELVLCVKIKITLEDGRTF